MEIVIRKEHSGQFSPGFGSTAVTRCGGGACGTISAWGVTAGFDTAGFFRGVGLFFDAALTVFFFTVFAVVFFSEGGFAANAFSALGRGVTVVFSPATEVVFFTGTIPSPPPDLF